VAVGWVAEQLAAPQLGLEEAFGVVPRGEAQCLGGGVERLDDHATAALAAPAAAGQLCHQREGALLRAEIREAQRGIGVQDDAERDVGEVVPLRHHLGADQHPRVRMVEAPQDRGHAGRRGHVRVEPEHGQRRHQLLQLPLQLLGPRAVARNRYRLALRAHPRSDLAVAAVVAGHLAALAVEHERDVAVRALPHARAGAAGEEVRPAAPVQQDDRLLTAAAHLVERLTGALVERSGRTGHAHDLHRRQAPPVDARGQHDPLVGEHALGPRRGAPRHQQRALLGGPALRHRAGVVAGIALLLVGAVVLLVDDDQPEVVERCEHGRARADADARLAAAQPPPLVVALAL
jgi:hypothetical protein